MRAGSWVTCRVADNGSGLGRIRLGRGLRIVGALANSLGGRIDRTSGAAWNSFSLDFPLTQGEQRAKSRSRRVPSQIGRRSKTMPPLPSAPAEGERQIPSLFSHNSSSKEIYNVDEDISQAVRGRVARRRRRRA
jgi:hypothetical protein